MSLARTAECFACCLSPGKRLPITVQLIIFRAADLKKRAPAANYSSDRVTQFKNYIHNIKNQESERNSVYYGTTRRIRKTRNMAF
jgi:hypothetical protein